MYAIHYFSTFLNSWNIFITAILMGLCVNSIISVNSRLVSVDYFSFVYKLYIAALCLPINFLLDTSHCEVDYVVNY